jgi:uncharacterized membrane protein affecting hemolysin expression
LTLSSWFKLVKSELIIALTATLLTAVVLAALWRVDPSEQAHTTTLGEGLAATLAQSSIDALLEQDSLHLGVLANRLTDIDIVSGAAIYSIDDEVVALSGKLVGDQFSHPILMDDTVIGFARVTLDDSRAGLQPDWGRRAASLLLLLVIPFMIAAITHIRRSRRRGVVDVDIGAAETRQASEHYILVANLHNQLSMSPAERQQVMQQSLDLAQRVGDIYQAQCLLVPGKGLLMDFGPADGDDRPFQVVCAAFVLANCLAESLAQGDYRMGLHGVELFEDEDAVDHIAVLEDTTLLAALGKPHTVVASESFFADIERPERITAELLQHAMLDELTTTGRQCCLITSLGETHRALIGNQAERLVASLYN